MSDYSVKLEKLKTGGRQHLGSVRVGRKLKTKLKEKQLSCFCNLPLELLNVLLSSLFRVITSSF